MFHGLFGPLDRQYCLYFYYVSVIGLLLTALSLVSLVGYLLKAKKKEPVNVFNILLISISYFFMYLSSRIIYTMCVKVL